MKTRIFILFVATLTFCGAMMMLTSCSDSTDSVQPVDPIDPTAELAKETFYHEERMDRSVSPATRSGSLPLGHGLRTMMPPTQAPMRMPKDYRMSCCYPIWLIMTHPWPDIS